jgi:hypothetical protein
MNDYYSSEMKRSLIILNDVALLSLIEMTSENNICVVEKFELNHGHIKRVQSHSTLIFFIFSVVKFYNRKPHTAPKNSPHVLMKKCRQSFFLQ